MTQYLNDYLERKELIGDIKIGSRWNLFGDDRSYELTEIRKVQGSFHVFFNGVCLCTLGLFNELVEVGRYKLVPDR